MIVVDTNIIAYHWIPGIFTDFTEKLFFKDPVWVTSPLWKYEFRSTIATYVRKKLIDVPDAIQTMEEAEAKMQGKEISVPPSLVMSYLSKSKCSAYDCEFVALADHFGIPLITVDKLILSEFPGIAIQLSKYVATITSR